MTRRTVAVSDRIRRAHAQTRSTLRVVLALVAIALVWGTASGSRWLALHVLLAGAVVLAISGVSSMLTVTWAAAPAPSTAWVVTQRACIVVGALGIAVARQANLPDAVLGTAGVIYAIGLLLLAVLLVWSVRHGVQRRYDVAVAGYVAAVCAGLIGVGLGAAMGLGTPSPSARSAHVTANLLGLVGLVVAATMPFFAATVGRSRIAPHATPARLATTLGWLVAALLLTLVGFASEHTALVTAGFGIYAAGVALVVSALPRPGRRGLQWAGPRLVALWAGACWWFVAVAITAVDAGADRAVLGGRWLWVLVVAAYAQIVWGSLAYLLPVLRGGGHELLTEGFETSRSWLGLGAANAAGVCLALAAPTPVTATFLVVWVLDGAWRAARIGVARAPRPEELPDDNVSAVA